MQKHSGALCEIASVDGWVHLQDAARGFLDAVRHGLRDDITPLRNGALGDSNCPGDGGAVVIPMRQNFGLSHEPQSTAC